MLATGCQNLGRLNRKLAKVLICSHNQKKFVPAQSALHEARLSANIFYLNVNFCNSPYIRVNLRTALLQTVWIQIRIYQLSDLIII